MSVTHLTDGTDFLRLQAYYAGSVLWVTGMFLSESDVTLDEEWPEAAANKKSARGAGPEKAARASWLPIARL